MGNDRSHAPYTGPGSLPRSPADPFAGFGAPSVCQPGHHQLRPSAPSTNLRDLVQYLDTHVDALRLTGDDLVSTTIEFSDDDKQIFRTVATAWELANSRVLTLASRWVPVVDDGNAILAYAWNENRGGVYHFWVRDIHGEVIYHTITGEEGLQDSIGNDILAMIVTLGASAIVRGVASGLAARLSSAVARGIVNLSIGAARRLAGEGGERAVLLVLRAMRARAIVAGLQRRGLQAVVNIGGEAASGEVAEFGANQIALNNAVRMGAARRYIPNLVKEPGENIGEVFAQETIDRVVSRRLDRGFDVNRVAQGAFRVLKRGGSLNMHVYAGDAGFGRNFTEALMRAGFRDVRSVGNSLFTAVKP